MAVLDRSRETVRNGADKKRPDGIQFGRRLLDDGAHGYVNIVDRVKDLIKSGGEWISSSDLESALSEHPAVREAAVVGVPDPIWQERPVAFVHLADDWDGRRADFAAFLQSRFPRWQIPDHFVVLNDLPRGATGKVDKTRLRELSRSRS